MPLLFWMDVTALSVSALISTSLMLIVLGSGPRRTLNRFFAVFVMAGAVYAVSALLMRLALWLDVGNPLLLLKVATLGFVLMGPLLLMFTIHYLDRRRSWADLAATLGLTTMAVLSIFMVRHQVVFNPRLGANGAAMHDTSTLGFVMASVPILCLVWSVVLFWQERRRAGEAYLVLSVLALLVGFVLGGVLDLPFPGTAITTTFGVALLGYGVVSRQLFNPLRERTAELQREIGERVRAEAEILRLQHLLQNITNSMPSALITLDPDGSVLTWNPAAESLTGRVTAQVLGQVLWQVCPELDRYRDLFRRVVSEGQVAHRHKEQLVTESGTIYRDVSVFPLKADAVEGAVLRVDDVTQRVQMEDIMLHSAKMASVGGLAAGVAHEINNPLGAMVQSAQMVQIALDVNRPRTREHLQRCGIDLEGLERYLREQNLLEYLDGIRNAGGRAAKIVCDLLSFSRKTSYETVPHDLNMLVEQALDLAAADYDLEKKYDFRHMEIVRKLAPDLPQVVCDGQQIQQVVLNLVRNAAQAMASSERQEAHSGCRPRLTLRTSLTGSPSPFAPRHSFVRLEVEDNGPGIPESVRVRLFEPFFTTKKVGEGTGFGLWLCWSIVVERHGGRIWTESVLSEAKGSEAERGCRFVVELPVT